MQLQQLFRVNISLNLVHIDNISGTFQNNEVLTFTKENSTTFQVSSKSSGALTDQTGALIAVKTSDTTALSSGCN